MTLSTSAILNVLRNYDVIPEVPVAHSDQVPIEQPSFSDVGEVREGEAIYATSISEILNDAPEQGQYPDLDDERLGNWKGEIEGIIRDSRSGRPRHEIYGSKNCTVDSPEPHCAWYCPIHFFGHAWGIYIRENCILTSATDIARLVDWPNVTLSNMEAIRHLLRSAFYVFYLHEQFHHKIESLGFRLLVATGTDRYRPYKANVYRPLYLTNDCLEESLANAESYRRLIEPRYTRRLDKRIIEAQRAFLQISIPMQPPGYAQGTLYIDNGMYRDALYKIQSQMLEGAQVPVTPLVNWSVAPNMITSLANIADDIYIVLPRGAKPLFRPTTIDPRVTVSTNDLIAALTKYYGYKTESGGKGSHVKLKKPDCPTIILPGNRPVLSPGVIKHALEALGERSLAKLPDLIEGRLA